MITVCSNNMCTGCMACIEVCPQNAIYVEDAISFYRTVIDEKKCINCNACRYICQNNNNIEFMHPIQWNQGWMVDNSLRAESSSGGAAAALSHGFIKKGGIVCSCVFTDGKFGFEFAETLNELNKFKGSKYVKSNPAGIYGIIKNKAKEGKKILFIGLPCQVAALKRFVGSKIGENLYTVDLICHGTPSPKLLERFLNDYGYSLKKIKDIQFRKKISFIRTKIIRQSLLKEFRIYIHMPF